MKIYNNLQELSGFRPNTDNVKRLSVDLLNDDNINDKHYDIVIEAKLINGMLDTIINAVKEQIK